MKNYLKIFAITLIVGLSACSTKPPEVKSPCVGTKGSPCERRNPLYNQA